VDSNELMDEKADEERVIPTNIGIKQKNLFQGTDFIWDLKNAFNL
jgi:hypothetical protein